jgi:inner membrane protein
LLNLIAAARIDPSIPGDVMPLTPTHALVPIAAAIAFAPRPVPWKLVAAAAIAAMLPDVDFIGPQFLGIPSASTWGHRGATHSLFFALVAGALAAACNRRLGVRALTAGVAVAAAMASHGLLDMMTDRGQAVAYLWPLTSERFFADWRPIHGGQVQLGHLVPQLSARLASEFRQFAGWMLLGGVVVRLALRPGRAAR